MKKKKWLFLWDRKATAPNTALSERIIVGENDWGESIIRCPYCSHTDELEYFDCIGADDDCLFCNACNREMR